MRVLELYSGIGGMNSALSASGLNFQIKTALDINDLANKVYNNSCKEKVACNRLIDSLSVAECLRLNADLWTMSPPCQPFTRLGKCKQNKDNRISSLHTVMDRIEKVRPPAILLENVKGFEGSDAWKDLIKIMINSDYDIRQFLLTPIQFGIPNSRLRYYLVAKLRNSNTESVFNFGESLPIVSDVQSLSDVLEVAEAGIINLPLPNGPALANCSCTVCTGKVRNITSTENHFEKYLPFCRPVQDFLLSPSDIPENSFLSKEKTARYLPVLDIVNPLSHKTACFTKGYAHRLEGTGSFLLLPEKVACQEEMSVLNEAGDEIPTLRYFHSQEIANLMGFPSSFKFPHDVTEKQRIRLLGNSVNVLVVAHVMFWAFSEAN